MGKFEIRKTKSGQFKFDLKASNGQVILSSETYKSKSGCKNGVNSVMRNSKEDKRYDRKTAKNGSPYFNLKANNGQIIGTSEMYSNTSGMENGIASVKKNAAGATVDDQS
jgi:uncharacterized protein YegP (UPF0339 family)